MIKKRKVVIIGAGPSGLTSAYELLLNGKDNFDITIIEKNNVVGGLARTIKYKDCLFDIGPHRFFTKNDEVMAFWKKIMGNDFKKVKRLTRMYYRNNLFLYPVELRDVIRKLSPVDLVRMFSSFIYSKIFLKKYDPKNFEEYIIKHFGEEMYCMFFKTYTEKVWGIPCNEIEVKWANQRIKNLSLTEVLKKSIFKDKSSKSKSLVDEFHYPTKGAGHMFQTIADDLVKHGVKILLESEVNTIKHSGGRITEVKYIKERKKYSVKVDILISSMPLTLFVNSLNPLPNKNILTKTNKIYYRDHITVNLIINGKSPFLDNWIYVHSPDVKLARIANYNSMSRKMAGKNKTAISVEYFLFQTDEIWKMNNSEISKLAGRELELIGLVRPNSIADSFVIRETETYPVYFMGYERHFNPIKKYVSGFSNLELIGRGGMFKYNNMDHAMFSGMLAARNIIENKKVYDVWKVNTDAEYLEEK